MEPMTPISCPTTPRWNQDRPFLTGRFHQVAPSLDLFLDLFCNSLESNLNFRLLFFFFGLFNFIKRIKLLALTMGFVFFLISGNEGKL